MLEVQAHQQLKQLLHLEEMPWEHHLTLSRLIGRSLRRQDRTRIRLSAGERDRWWLGLLVPLCLQSQDCVLVLNERQRQRFLQVELPRLRQGGLRLACWSGCKAPPGSQLWLLSPAELVNVHRRQGFKRSHQLIIPEAESLAHHLRQAMQLSIKTQDWDRLRQAYPTAGPALLDLHERLSRRLFATSCRSTCDLPMPSSALVSLRDLIGLLGPAPEPWTELLNLQSSQWASWAHLDQNLLQWTWALQPLEPLQTLHSLLEQHPSILLQTDGVSCERSTDSRAMVDIQLHDRIRTEPLRLFAPRRQPLPNTEIYAEHLLDQCRRLILGRRGLTLVLLDDPGLRQKLTTELAGEFGSRVIHQDTAPEVNGVICSSWSWWMDHQNQLPSLDQLIVALLPVSSLEDPLTAARVESLKKLGKDWFRDLLLPEALAKLVPAIAPLRQSGGRLAILDGRVRARSWGKQVLRALEPWAPLQRLLPD
jgi:ATP-dependent DNA helicase DinG